MAQSYSQLIGAKASGGSGIRDWVNQSVVPVTELLLEAEAYIYQTLRAREMIREIAWTAAVGASTLAFPVAPSYLLIEPITLSVDGIYQKPAGMDYCHEASAFRQYRDESGDLIEGLPNEWAIFNEVINFNFELDEALAGDFLYYGQPPALSASNETNFLTVRFPTLLRQVCTMLGYEYLKQFDARAEQKILADEAIAKANAVADGVRRGQWR